MARNSQAVEVGTPAPEMIGGECPEYLVGKHVGGRRVEELPAVWQYLTVAHTDEGIAEASKGAGRVGGVRSELSAQFDKRRDELLAGAEPWEATNPLTSVAEANVGPGMRPKFLNEARVKRDGGHSRGWQVVKGADGDPVRVGDSVLAQMPEAKAEQRNAFYRNKARKIERADPREAATNKLMSTGNHPADQAKSVIVDRS